MPGINTTGAPDTRDYNLGRGILRGAKLNALGLPDTDGFRDLGNAPEFNVNIAVEDLRHQSSREQLKFTDARCVISQEVGLSYILDESNFQNLGEFLAGDTAIHDNPHDTTFTAVANVVTTAVKRGNWYALEGPGVDQRLYNLDAAGLVFDVVVDPAGTPVSLVQGTDFEMDLQMGLLRILPTSAAVADGDIIGFAITTGATVPQDLDQVNALTGGSVTLALLFVAKNACDNGQKMEVYFHKVSVSADGDYSLISDEITQLPFTGVAQVNSAIPGPSKVMRARTYDQAV